MAHCKKFTRAACGHMFKHYERAKDENGEYVKFGNQDIDTSKSHLNYNLAPIQHNGQGGFVKERCSEVKMQNRKDVNVMCSWVVTAPKEVQENNETEIFFRETYKFLSERYGRENVVSAYVHMDETTPHMHFAFVPVVMDKKKNIPKVSAKEAIDKKELQIFHEDLLNYMVRTFGRDMGILNEATKEGNQTIAELKSGTAKKELEEIKQQTSTFKEIREKRAHEAQEVNKHLETLKEEEKTLEKEIKALEKIFSSKQLTQEDLEKIQPIQGWFGVKNVTVKDIKNLKKMAMTTMEEKKAMNKAEQEIERLKEENIKLKKEKKENKKEHDELKTSEWEKRKKNAEYQVEIRELKEDLKYYKDRTNFIEETIERLPETIKKYIEPIINPPQEKEHSYDEWER